MSRPSVPAVAAALAGIMSLPAQASEDATTHFIENVRGTLAQNIAGTTWRSDCYIAANGLSAVTKLELLDKEHPYRARMATTYYVDEACGAEAGWKKSEERTLSLEVEGGDPAGYRLVGPLNDHVLSIRGEDASLELSSSRSLSLSR